MELTEEQFNCIAKGMEYYHRMMCGQVDVVDDVCRKDRSLAERSIKRNRCSQNLYGRYRMEWVRTKALMVKEMARSYQIYREMIFFLL